MRQIRLHPQPDGSLIDWGRHWRRLGADGEGGAKHYTGEAAEVLRLVTQHTRREVV